MRWRVVAGLAVMATAVVLGKGSAGAQVTVRLGGESESFVGLDTRRAVDGTTQTLTWGSRYLPQLDGIIWHPRFLTYSLGAVFADQTTEGGPGHTELMLREPYRLNVHLFPQAPHSFTINANRSTATNEFLGERASHATTTTTESQGLVWRYRGGGFLPAGALDFNRTTAESETADLVTTSTVTRIALQAGKSFSRANPTIRYQLEMRDGARSDDTEESPTEIGHTIEYNDRYRIGERLLVTPSVTYQINPAGEGATSNTTLFVPFAGQLSPTLDGATSFRYSLGQGQTFTHTVGADGTLTKRFTADLVLGGGVNGAVVRTDEAIGWGGGTFANLTFNPFGHLRTASGYALSLSAADAGITYSHRGQLSVTSTVVPKHTFGGSYFVGLTQPPEQGRNFWNHSWQVGATSGLIPMSSLDASYAVTLHESDGRELGHNTVLNVTFTPPLPVSLAAGGEFTAKSSSGPSRATSEERTWGVHAGVNVSPVYWFSSGISARRGVRELSVEDNVGEFVSERLTGTLALNVRAVQARTEGFVEREVADDRTGWGVRANIGYRFRVWSLSLDVERTTSTSHDIALTQDRVMFRLSRSLANLFSWP